MDWLQTELGIIYDVRDGTHDSPKYIEDGYPLVTSKNLKNGDLTLDKVKFISEDDFISINKRSGVDIGDVLMAMIGTIGNPIIIKDKPNFAIKNVALFKVPENQNSAFLKYYLESNFVIEKMKKEAKGTTQKFVGLGYLRKFPIEIPKLEEQKRIVAILDEAFEQIDQAKANAEQNLKNARDLFDGSMNELFNLNTQNREHKKLVTITSILGDGLHGTPTYSEQGDFYFINGNNLNNGEIVFKKNTKRVCYEEFEKYKKPLNDRTILVSINGTLGNVAFYNGENVVLGKSACYFNLLDGIDKQYIKFVFKSPLFQNYAHSVATGATIKNVSLRSMREFQVPLAPLDVQKNIVLKLNELEKQTESLESIYQQKIQALDELKQSLLQKAFSGELTNSADGDAA